jgi:IS1 family transposase
MNRLSNDDRCRVVACLVEGNSIRATVRITGIAKKTVSRLGVELGEACEKFASKVMVNLPCKDIQCDEIWSFTYAKEKNVPAHLRGTGAGDTWTWIAIDRETKLIPVWYIGDRTAESAYKLMRNLSPRLANRVQLSTDGHHAYLIAVKAAFLAGPVDYGMLIKIYGDSTRGYSPGECIGARRETIMGKPDVSNICTSHAERNNLTVRMQMRRFTRLTNGFSKKVENHRLACAVHFVHYNFARIHSSLRITPAMAAGLTDHVWELSELVNLLEADEAKEAVLCA